MKVSGNVNKSEGGSAQTRDEKPGENGLAFNAIHALQKKDQPSLQAQGYDNHTVSQENNWHSQAKPVKPVQKAKNSVSVNDSNLQYQVTAGGMKTLQAKKPVLFHGPDNSASGDMGANYAKPRQLRKGIPFSSSKEHSPSLLATAQLMSAADKGITNGYEEILGNTPLYNAGTVSHGSTYKKQINVGANGIDGAIAGYIAETRVMGTATGDANMTFLDKIGNPPQVPSEINWGFQKKRENYIKLLRTHLKSTAGTFDNHFNWGADDYQQAKDFIDRFEAGRQLVRSTDAIGAVDPFVARVELKAPNNDIRTFETVYSHSAYGYIVAIEDPKLGGHRGEIRSVADYANQKDQDVGADDPYIYSAAHVKGNDTIADQLDIEGAQDKKGKYHERLDALTRLGAEGARFKPFEKAKQKLQWDTRFYGTLKPNVQESKYAEYGSLANKWGQWFNRDYGITNDRMKNKIDEKGEVKAEDPRANVDFLLTKDDFAQ